MTPHNQDDEQDNVVSLNQKSESGESEEINQRISQLKEKHGLDEEKDKQAKATNEGVKAGIDLLTPIVVCFFIGMGIDNWLDTSPIFLMIFFVLGVITGFWNIYKLTK